MTQQQRIRVFIGSGDASLLERKTLIHSLRKHTQRELDIYVMNGTHNAIELNDGEPFLAPMSLRVKYRNITEFSLYRFIIPELCNYQGKAIYLDSDMVCLSDIGELFDTPMNGCSFLAKQGAYMIRPDLWGLSSMLIDCEKTKFDLETIFDEIDRGLYDYTNFLGMSSSFLTHHPYKVGALNPQWNVLDYCDRDTKLIHYTKLSTQPWKYPNHPYGELWFNYFNEAVTSGYITQDDIKMSMRRAYVRLDLLKGNYSFLGREKSYIGQTIRPFKRITTGAIKKVKKIIKSSNLTIKPI